MDVRFVIVAPSPARKSFKVRLPVVVGRGDEAKFRIQQDSVSRLHCEFAHEGGVVTVTDLGSTNGTLVAGTRIAAHAATAVPNGAEVRIGGTVLRVEYAGKRDAAIPAPAAAHEADTVPLASSAPAAKPVEVPEVESLPELEAADESAPALQVAGGAGPAAAGVPADGPAFPDADAPAAATEFPAFPDVEPAPAPAEVPAFQDVAPASPPAEGSFDFLGGEAAAPPAADDKLDDFFKSLS